VPSKTLTQQYRDHLKEEGYSVHTIDCYLGDIYQASQAMGVRNDAAWVTLEPVTVRAYLAGLAGRNSNATVSRKLASLRHFCHWLVYVRVRPDNPTVGIRHPKKVRTVRPVDPSVVSATVEAARSQSKNPQRDTALLLLMSEAGLKSGEIAGLRTDDYAPHARAIRVGERAVLLSEETAEALDLYLGDRSSGRVFLTDDGLPISRHTLWKILDKRAENAGVPRPSARTFRHGVISGMIADGTDAASIARFFGLTPRWVGQMIDHTTR
jgi:integrase/recombinase XerD